MNDLTEPTLPPNDDTRGGPCSTVGTRCRRSTGLETRKHAVSSGFPVERTGIEPVTSGLQRREERNDERRRPASRSAGPYTLRHTFATEALAAAVSTFELARLMGTSVAMIDRTYGHLARDSEDSIRARLDARAGRTSGPAINGSRP